jgi:hypothetical protein
MTLNTSSRLNSSGLLKQIKVNGLIKKIMKLPKPSPNKFRRDRSTGITPGKISMNT